LILYTFLRKLSTIERIPQRLALLWQKYYNKTNIEPVDAIIRTQGGTLKWK
jgi:hypothetical protein